MGLGLGLWFGEVEVVERKEGSVVVGLRSGEGLWRGWVVDVFDVVL